MGLFIPVILGFGLYKLAKATVDEATQPSESATSEDKRKEDEERREQIHKELEDVRRMTIFWGRETDELGERRIKLQRELDQLNTPQTTTRESTRRERMTEDQRQEQREIAREVRRQFDWNQPPITPQWPGPEGGAEGHK